MSTTECPHRQTIVTVDAGHDVYGNPRRALQCVMCRLTIDEGYAGDSPQRIRAEFGPHASHSGQRYKVKVSDYRNALRRTR